MHLVYSPTWQPILDLLQRLRKKVQLLDLGGDCLPALRETAELEKVQQTQPVSLALPTFGSFVTDWHREWTVIALEFGQQAYDPVHDDSHCACYCQVCQCATWQPKLYCRLSRIGCTCPGIVQHRPVQGPCAQVPG